MAEFDWNGLGRDIRDLVQDAVNSREFHKLNNEINRAIEHAFDGVGSSMREAGKAAGKAVDEAARTMRGQTAGSTHSSSWQSERYGRRTGAPWPNGQYANGRYANGQYANGQYANGQYANGQQRNPAANRPAVPYQNPLYISTEGRKILGYAMAIGGYGLAVVFGILLVIAGVAAVLGAVLGEASFGGLLSSALPFAGSVALGAAGSTQVSRIQRFRSYIRILGNRTYCELKELTAKTGRSLKYIRKDLKKLIEKRWFVQGHLDTQGTCLMITDEVYQRYIDTEAQRAQLAAREKEKALAQKQEKDALPAEVLDVLEAGEAYVKRIRKCNDDIPGVEISNKIFRIEELVQQIFARVKEHPEVVSDLRKMMDYYLPTTIKLLDAYIELDRQSVQGEHITSSKQEIEQVLDTLNVAFEKLLDSLFRDAAWDVSADISVLNAMLAQEGLTKSDFRREKEC